MSKRQKYVLFCVCSFWRHFVQVSAIVEEKLKDKKLLSSKSEEERIHNVLGGIVERYVYCELKTWILNMMHCRSKYCKIIISAS